MSDLDLDAIKARCAAATREPWKASCAPGAASVRSEWANCAIYINVRKNGETPECVTRWHRDAEFTAHARTDVPALVAEVERLREIKCDKVDCDRVEKDRREALARAETAEADVARLRSDLAECYRITGADPDGDDDAMLATKAVAAVKRLREESDTEAETAGKLAELLMSDLDESESMGPAAWDEALTAVRAAVAARAKETVPPALKPGDLAHEPSCIHAKNGSTGMIDARGRCAFCTPTKKENTR